MTIPRPAVRLHSQETTALLLHETRYGLVPVHVRTVTQSPFLERKDNRLSSSSAIGAHDLWGRQRRRWLVRPEGCRCCHYRRGTLSHDVFAHASLGPAATSCVLYEERTVRRCQIQQRSLANITYSARYTRRDTHGAKPVGRLPAVHVILAISNSTEKCLLHGKREKKKGTLSGIK